MKSHFINKRNLFIISGVVILVLLFYYMRERKFIIHENTDITIEFNNMNIHLSDTEETEFKHILNSIKIHRPFNRIDGPYHNESTIFIRIHNTEETAATMGMLTVCLDNRSRSNFSGLEPEGRFQLKKEDLKKIVDFLYPMMISSGT